MKRFVLISLLILCLGFCARDARAQATEDPDHDNLTTMEEQAIGTDPWMTDTDRDGIGDGTEVAMGTDPLDQGSKPEISLSISRLRVTDVTPRAFSLVWVSNQEASCFANVYTDAEGSNLIKDVTIMDESAGHPPAGQNGVMKVKVSGLNPDSLYYFQIVTVSGELVQVEPASGPLPSVRTELTSVVVNNDLLAHRILMSDGLTPAEGALLLAEVQGGSYPITGWVGDGVSVPWAFVDLNNVYSKTERKNLELFGGEAITLESVGGLLGFRRLYATVPGETGLVQTLSPEPSDEECTLDNAGPVIETEQLSPAPGVAIGYDIPLISGTYSDPYSEIDVNTVRLLVDDVDVTDQAIVSFTGVEYTPTTPLSEGVHNVTLSVSDEWGYAADPAIWSFVVDMAAPTATIQYSTITPTPGNVVATLESSEPITVTNNEGQLSYTFDRNGSFTFEFVDPAGRTGSATATVSWIVKRPRGLRIERK